MRELLLKDVKTGETVKWKGVYYLVQEARHKKGVTMLKVINKKSLEPNLLFGHPDNPVPK